MKKEAKALLKTKFPGVQLSEARQESIATRAAAKATTVEELDAVLDELNDAYPFADIAKEDDRLRSLEAEVKKKTETEKSAEEKKAEEEAAAAASAEDKDTPAWAKALVESNKSLAEEIKSIKSEKAITSYKERATKSLNLNGLDEETRNSVLEDIEDRTFNDDEHFDKYIERQSKILGTAAQNATDDQFGNDTPVGGVKPVVGKVKEATDKELEALNSKFR